MTKTNNNNNAAITVKRIQNVEKNGIELYFSGKPSEEVRQTLKDAGYRWHSTKSCWYAKDNAETRALADKISPEKPKAKRVPKAEKAEKPAAAVKPEKPAKPAKAAPKKAEKPVAEMVGKMPVYSVKDENGTCKELYIIWNGKRYNFSGTTAC